jgi:hypothetical protein
MHSFTIDQPLFPPAYAARNDVLYRLRILRYRGSSRLVVLYADLDGFRAEFALEKLQPLTKSSFSSAHTRQENIRSMAGSAIGLIE